MNDLTSSKGPDILEVISDLSSDEVFTPPRVVAEMLDLFPTEVWSNSDLRWLDPGCKTGVFLREITRRLMSGIAGEIPDEQERLQHILTNQVFGIAITELTSLMSRRTLYCSKNAAGDHSVVRMPSSDGNIWFQRVEHTYVNGKCRECSAAQSQMESDNRENYAYPFIHEAGRIAVWKDLGMKFDVIVGNPPYQMEDGGNKASSSPIYHYFVEQAKLLNPKYLALIIPSRWFAGGKGLDQFRTAMLKDRRVKELVDFTDASQIFPNVDIAGGVCYFLWDRDYAGRCTVKTWHGTRLTESERFLDDHDTFVRFSEALPILEKVNKLSEEYFVDKVSSRKPFGLDTTAQPDPDGELTLYWRGGRGPIRSERISIGRNFISKWKLITSYTSYDHAGQHDQYGQRRVLSKLDILAPNEVCSETYIVLDTYDSRNEAESALGYFKTKFVRFLISLASNTQHITKERFVFVPVVPMDRDWSDEKLYTHFGLSKDESTFIESVIKEMP